MSESKQDRFHRLVEPRKDKVLQGLKVLTNLSRKGDYDYSDRDASDLMNVLEKAMTGVGEAFGVSKMLPPPPPPVTADKPLAQENFRAGKLDHQTATWAYEMLSRGKVEEAKIMLKRALQGGVE